MNTEEILAFYKNASTGELMSLANKVCRQTYGDEVFLRGLIEFTNQCNLDCLYCGIRKSNDTVRRYRMNIDDIIELAALGMQHGLKTFVLQGGEDPWFTSDKITELIEGIQKIGKGELALTLSIGIRSREVYKRWKDAGATRYLMRFETSDKDLYKYLKNGAELDRRLEALVDLGELGYEVGSGYMVGLPGETEEIRIQNALLCQKLKLAMVGLGPFIPHPQTPLAQAKQEPLELVLRATALVRLLLPQANMPATTAAGSLDNRGRERMLAAGANVLMPNISPESLKKDYLLYPGKICLDESGFECINCLSIRTKLVDKKLSWARGDNAGKVS